MKIGLIRRWRPALCAFGKFVSITALGELVTAVGCVAINSCLRLLLAAKRPTSKLSPQHPTGASRCLCH